MMTPDHWIAWSGIEVEGRFAGLPTLFVRNARPHHVTAILARVEPHLYLNPEIEPAVRDTLAQRAMRQGKVVTLCLRPDQLAAFSTDYRPQNLTVVFDLPAALGSGDSVRIDCHSNPPVVLCGAVLSMTRTIRFDYERDKPFLEDERP
jgi:hypothetical protein